MDNPIIGTRYESRDIYQANPLIESCKNMDLNEGRLFYLGLMELRPQLREEDEVEDFKTITIPTAELIKLFGGHKDYYKRLKYIADKLIARKIGIKEDDKAQVFSWINIFSRMEFDVRKGGLQVKFNIDMKPYVFQLAGKPYTRIAAKTIFSLSSMYAIRLIELMLQYQNIKIFKENHMIERKLSVQELREFLQVPEGAYRDMYDFKKNVLDAPILDVNYSTPYRMEYEVVKEGRKVEGFIIRLDISCDTGDVDSVDKLIAYKNGRQADNATVDNTEATSEEVLLHYGVGKIVAKRLAKEYSPDEIRNNIRYAMQQKKVKNLGAYIVKAIREDFATAHLMAEQAKEEAERARREASGQITLFEIEEPHREPPITELNEFAAGRIKEFIRKEIALPDHYKKILNQLGLSIDDVLAGKRK